MEPRVTFKFLRKLIREIAEGGVRRTDLTSMVMQAIALCYDDPEEAVRQSDRDIDELEQSS